MTPGLLREPAFAVGLGGIALFFGGLTGTRLVLTRFLQTGRHFTAGDAGPGNLSLAMGTAIGDAVGGSGLTDRIGRKVPGTGPLVQLVGAALLRFELDGLGTGTFSIRDLAPGVVVAGVGAGVVVAARFSFILAAVDDDGTGSASGVLSGVRSVGGSIGVAVFGSVFFAQAGTGGFTAGFHHALRVQARLPTAILALIFLLPAKGRPEDEQPGSTTDAPSGRPSGRITKPQVRGLPQSDLGTSDRGTPLRCSGNAQGALAGQEQERAQWVAEGALRWSLRKVSFNIRRQRDRAGPVRPAGRIPRRGSPGGAAKRRRSGPGRQEPARASS